MTALESIYESIKDRTVIDYKTFKDSLKDWEVIPLIENKQVIGGVLKKDNELHVGYGIKPSSSIRKYIKNILGKVIQEHGFAVTSVMEDNLKGIKFCKRLGFYEMNKDNGKINLKCDRCNYVE